MRNIAQHVEAIVDRPINVLEIAKKIEEGEITHADEKANWVLRHIGQVRDGISTLRQIATEKTLGDNGANLKTVQENLRIDDGTLSDIINSVRTQVCNYVTGDYVRSVVAQKDSNAIAVLREALEENVPYLDEILRFGFSVDEVVTEILSQAAEMRFTELETEKANEQET